MALRGCNKIDLDRTTQAVRDRNNNVSGGAILSLFLTSALKSIYILIMSPEPCQIQAVKALRKALRVSELIELFRRAWSGLR